MGQLVEGVWSGRQPPAQSKDGRFMRAETQFRNWVTADGSPGPTGAGGFAAEPGRYHLYVSLACPWAHRTLIMRSSRASRTRSASRSCTGSCGRRAGSSARARRHRRSPVRPRATFISSMPARSPTTPAASRCRCCGTRSGETIVNNESAEIIRMLNAAFDGVGAHGPDFYPEPLRAGDRRDQRPRLRARQQRRLQGRLRAHPGGLRGGGRRALFETLDELEERLARQRYLAGDRLTEADCRLFTTLVRFDPVYVGHFKCNLQAARRLPEPVGLRARAVPATRASPAPSTSTTSSSTTTAATETVNPSGIVPHRAR